MTIRLLILAVFCVQIVCAQNPITIRQLTTNNGLSQNSVNDALEDRDGYIWLATQDGLCRYNGYDFKIFRLNPEDSFSISDNYIIEVAADSRGRIWMPTRKGLNVYDKETDRFSKILSRSSSGNFSGYFFTLRWSEGATYFRDNAEPTSLWKVDDSVNFKNAHYYIEDIGEKIWTAPKAFDFVVGGRGSFILKNREMINLNSGKVKGIDIDIEINPELRAPLLLSPNIYLLPHYKHLVTLDVEKQEITKHRENIRCYDFQRLNDSTVLIATNTGLYQIKNDLTGLEEININGVDLDQTIVHSLLKDRFGQIWIGTANKGVLIWNPDQREFRYPSPEALTEDIVWKVSTRGQTKLLATDNGLVTIDGENRPAVVIPNQKFTTAHIDRNGNYWGGTNQGYIFRHNPETNNTKSFGPISELDVTTILERGDSLIFGTYSGMKVFKNGAFVPLQIDDYGATYVMAMYIDSKENLWVGHSNGCSVFAPNGERTNFVPDAYEGAINFNFISGFAEDKVGNFWVASYGRGLSRLNADSTFSVFGENYGLTNEVIHGIVADANGYFWMTSNGGISRFNPADTSFVNFTTHNGLKSHNFQIASMHASNTGEINVGSVDGLLTFEPTKIQPLSQEPKIAWEQVRINYQKQGVDGDVNRLSSLVLDYEDRVVTLEFAAIKLDNPMDVKYSHKLEGFDEQWVELDPTSRQVTYSSLPYNEYDLLIRAESVNNHFDSVTRRLTIIVRPPYWLKWWFIALELVVFLAVAFGLVYHLSRRKLKAKVRALETREKIQAERERISRDLHDSVGTHFAYIVSRLDFLNLGWDRDKIDDKRGYLRKITEFARSGMRMLRETIWALSEEDVDSASLKAKIDDYLKLCFSDIDADYSFQFSSTETRINASLALNTFRIIQEAVSNSLKHSDATGVAVDFCLENSNLDLTIRDDGNGFNVANSKNLEGHYGLSNLEKRAAEMDASLQISSSEQGTEVLVVSRKNTP